MIDHRYGDYKIGFIDLLMAFIGVLAIIILFTFALMAIQKMEDGGVLRKADYIATITWDDKVDCDVDFWFRDPDKNTVSFRSKSQPLMALERDDLGFSGDTAQTMTSMANDIANGKEPIPPDQYNEETIVLRGTKEGTYTASVFLYSCRVIENGLVTKIKKFAPFTLDVEFKFMKINPYKIVHTKTVTFAKLAEEVPIVEFEMDANKHASGFKDTPVRIVTIDEVIQ